MLRFVLNHWRRQRFKFILKLVGALIISAGLSLMFNLTDSSQGTVEQTLQKKWSSSYDIVVRPKGSQMSTESSDLLEPNYLNGINGGISFKQYEAIKQMKEIDIAAPVAVMGYVNTTVNFKKKLKFPRTPGLYRITTTNYIQNGFNKERQSQVILHVAQGSKISIPGNVSFLTEPIEAFEDAVASNSILVVAIDPKEEARLVGLDKSVNSKNKSRYFSSLDRYEYDKSTRKNTIPVLVNPNSYNQGSRNNSCKTLRLKSNRKPDCWQRSPRVLPRNRS
ncbi:hypothetical protein [Exiguobacterium sp. s166]|uniref:hypothetical protein n=1 Tax=Exiguobacterium sp. s166 TaxID=2751204 RepID=UPI001BEC72BE|nr:hypothetical protein [Exiguobacterium sp. s166]